MRPAHGCRICCRTSRRRPISIAFLKGTKTEGSTHVISSLKLHTSGLTPGRPALGAWIQYGLGSANPDLPAFVVLPTGVGNAGGGRGAPIWSSGFLPATYQGIAFRQGDSPILYLKRPEEIAAAEQQKGTLELLQSLNQSHASHYPSDTELQARARSYDLAYRMQKAAPEAVDVAKESDATRKLYGLDDNITKEYGTALLRARRLVERNVRFIHVISGAPDNSVDSWDAHNNIEKNHSVMCRLVDKPVAGLLADLQVTRPARHDARRVDGGVRPHAVRPDRRRSRSQPVGLHDVDRRRRHQARHSRRDGRDRSARGQRHRRYLRPAGDRAPSARPRSHQAHVPAPGSLRKGDHDVFGGVVKEIIA